MADYWRVEAPLQESLREDPDDAVLVTRLGIAITALRASQRLTICVAGSDDPAEQSSRLWAFMLALSYLHEIRASFQTRWHRIKPLADAAGAPAELAGQVSDILLSGKSELSAAVDRIRNGLVFHFDEKPVIEWMKQYTQDPVVWFHGKGQTNGGIQYRASTDAVAWNILPGVDIESGPGRAQVIQLMEQVKDAQHKVALWFDYALAGYLSTRGARKVT